jgi:dihydrofolate reductase
MREIIGRKLLQSVLVSMNGVTSRPLEWAGPYFGPQLAERSLAALQQAGALLMGRVTYEIFSKQWPAASGEYADYLNEMPKYVFSSTLEHPEWSNTTVISGDVADAVSALKTEQGADLMVYGHGRFGQTICDAELVDELTVSVVPVFVADGTTFYRPGGHKQAWQLVTMGEADPGVAVLSYRRAE